MDKGIFITLEGGEGSGKTSTANFLTQKLTELGYDVLYTREPGGVQISEQIRDTILDTKNMNMDPITETLLYAASRRQHLVEKIIPALNQGKIVICDRYIDSSIVYQGFARRLGSEMVYNINKFAITDNNQLYIPDITLYFDVPTDIGHARILSRSNLDRIENEVETFHNRVRSGYLTWSKAQGERIKTIDASAPLGNVLDNAFKIVKEYIDNYNG